MTAARERVESCRCSVEGSGRGGTQARRQERPPDRVPFPQRVDHVELVCRAVDYTHTLDGPLAALLARLVSYPQATSGRGQLAEQRGATYKQVRYLAALADIPSRQMYETAERVPMSQAMSQAMIGYLISELKERAA